MRSTEINHVLLWYWEIFEVYSDAFKCIHEFHLHEAIVYNNLLQFVQEEIIIMIITKYRFAISSIVIYWEISIIFRESPEKCHFSCSIRIQSKQIEEWALNLQSFHEITMLKLKIYIHKSDNFTSNRNPKFDSILRNIRKCNTNLSNSE